MKIKMIDEIINILERKGKNLHKYIFSLYIKENFVYLELPFENYSKVDDILNRLNVNGSNIKSFEEVTLDGVSSFKNIINFNGKQYILYLLDKIRNDNFKKYTIRFSIIEIKYNSYFNSYVPVFNKNEMYILKNLLRMYNFHKNDSFTSIANNLVDNNIYFIVEYQNQNKTKKGIGIPFSITTNFNILNMLCKFEDGLQIIPAYFSLNHNISLKFDEATNNFLNNLEII